MRIYLSGKISGLTEIQYTKNFNLAIFQLVNIQHICRHNDIINPINLKPFLGIKTWLCYMITDLIALSKCTHIAMQKNWIDSRGAWLEYGFAKWIFKLKIIFL